MGTPTHSPTTNGSRRILLIALLGIWALNCAHANAQGGKMLDVITCDEDGIVYFLVQNLTIADVTVTVDLKSSNMEASTTNLPCTATIPGSETVELFTLAPVDDEDENVSPDFNYTYAATIGSTSAVHDDAYAYSLPYAPGSSFRVSQGYHGSFSHSGPDEYSIDWKMPVGTPVLAARDGLVVKSKDDSNQGGANPKFLNCANCVLIQHSDGTVGIYGHLKQGGNKVKVGDHVKAGDVLALSGDTGFTNGPHLHFSVFKTRNGLERVSMPVRFQTADQGALTLTDGKTYKAAPIEVPKLAQASPLTVPAP